MRIDKLIQTILMALAIVGVFAAMARNAYGYTLIGMACFGLALLYLAQIAWKLFTDYKSLLKEDIVNLIELALLALFLALFGFRAFYMYIPNGEYVFLGICTLLGFVYSFTAYFNYKNHANGNKGLAWNLVFLYATVIFFLISLGTRVFTSWSSIPGAFALLSAIPFLLSIIRKSEYDIDGKSVKLIKIVITNKNKAGLLFTFFVAAMVYVGLVRFDFIPAIENSSQPKAYIELINNAERRIEAPVDGKFKHESYKEAMDKFLDRHDPQKK